MNADRPGEWVRLSIRAEELWTEMDEKERAGALIGLRLTNEITGRSAAPRRGRPPGSKNRAQTPADELEHKPGCICSSCEIRDHNAAAVKALGITEES